MVNVLVVHNRYQYLGGEDTVFANEVQLLRKHGNSVYTYQRDNRKINDMPVVEKMFLPINNIFSIRVYFEIRKLIKEHQIQIVHVHNTLPLIGSAVFYAANSLKIPVVQTLHNYRMECPGGTLYKNGEIHEECVEHPFQSIKLRCYHDSAIQTAGFLLGNLFNRLIGTYRNVYFITLTKFSKRTLLRLNRDNRKIIDPKKVFIKPNFVFPAHVDSGWNTGTSGSDYFLYVGRLSEEKGILHLLNAWKRSKIKNRKLMICGDGPLASHVKKIVKLNHLNNVIIQGQVGPEKVMEYMQCALALIAPSQCYETFGMGLVEAMSVGTPVIASQIGAYSDIIRPNINGVLVPPNDAVVLGETLKQFNPTKFNKNEIKNLYLQNFAPEVNYKQLINIYSQII